MANTDDFFSDINEQYVETSYLRGITQRAILYLHSNYSVHLRGSAGVGKTSLAFHIAGLLDRPILFMSGSEEINHDNMIGGFFGLKAMMVEDNFISKVYKKEEQIRKTWDDGRLLTACKEGHTIIYDEFTRAKPEVNNLLMSVLEEKIVDTPYNSSANAFKKVHPDFRMIFTSNPDEYVGVYSSPNALLDRMITIEMDAMDMETQIRIVMAKSGLYEKDAMKVVELTHLIKKQSNAKSYASLRSSIMLARIVRANSIRMNSANELFRQICHDIYTTMDNMAGKNADLSANLTETVNEAIDKVFAIKGRGEKHG